MTDISNLLVFHNRLRFGAMSVMVCEKGGGDIAKKSVMIVSPGL
jgi:hypothetical protein